jgi:MOSC domain-containing protein YiiM
VEFFNTYQIKIKTIYAKMGEKIVAIDKHLIVDVLKISNKGWKEQKQANYKSHALLYYPTRSICKDKTMKC